MMRGLINALGPFLCLTSMAQADHWPANEKNAIAVREAAFCEVLSSYKQQMSVAMESQNDIRINTVYSQQILDIQALMPIGKFENWVMEVESVRVDANMSATLKARLPCHQTVVSLAIPTTETTLYGQLSDVSIGDFVLVSGSLTFDRDVDDRTPDVFGAKFNYIVGLN
jgi:hypothetical protein